MKTAIMTASYDRDFARCELLCESLDAHFAGDWTHYLLVESRDVAKFSALRGPRRVVVDEREILPGWLRPVPNPVSARSRRVWLSPFAKPLVGWHVQQLRRVGLARLVSEGTLLSIDSDVVIVRDFDPADLWQGDRLRLFRKKGGIDADMREHRAWNAHVSWLLGLAEPALPANDYVNTLIGWRSDSVRAMLDGIEARHGTGWVRAMSRSSAISECTLYGRYADEVLMGEGHFSSDQALCHVLWFRETYPEDMSGLRQFMAEMAPHQIAIGVQSFLDHEIADIRRVAAV